MAAPLDERFVALQEALLGRYSLERELGRGGMGTVYLARDVRLDRPVAIKALHPELAVRPDARRRFIAEARTAAALAHPHIVPIIAVEERETLVFIVMALVDGETLGERIRRRGPLVPEDAERMLRETAWALGYAHAHGVIHRDLTLENILLERGSGRALLADFGLAGASGAVESSPLFGTPGFLAPEVIRGESADPRSDLYALGVVGYTALAGRAPFEAETASQLLAKHLVQPPPPLAPLARGASRRLIEAIEACLAKDPDARPIDPPAFLARLERVPEPVAIAAPLRHWFTRWERIRPIYAMATPILALQTWLLIFAYQYEQSTALLTAALISTVLTLTAIPVGAHLFFEALSLRQLKRFGFGIDDIRAAYPHRLEEVRQERRREGIPPLPGRVVFDLTVIGAIVLIITFLFIYPNIDNWYAWRNEAIYVKNAILSLASNVYMATLIGVGIGFASPGFRLEAGGRFWRTMERFWRSPLARGVARLAAIGQRQNLGSGSTLHRNTELVLGLAVDDLWRNLPSDLRLDLGDVPALAHTLQASAAETRGLIERLHESERELDADGVDLPRLVATREALETRHKETVTALERLRLELLRLLASKQRTAGLTEQVAIARSLESSLLREVAGHREVRQLLGRAHRRHRSLTPTPTPSTA